MNCFKKTVGGGGGWVFSLLPFSDTQCRQWFLESGWVKKKKKKKTAGIWNIKKQKGKCGN